jgi:hypothetical protein
VRRGRLVLGSALLGLSLVPWVVAPVVPFLGFEPARAAVLIGGLVGSAELIGALAVAVLGREACTALRARWRRRKPEKARARGSSRPATHPARSMKS